MGTNGEGTNGEGMGFLEQMKGEISDCFYHPWRAGGFGAKAFWGGEENRAKDAKDAKVKGMEDDEIAGVLGFGGSGEKIWRSFL